MTRPLLATIETRPDWFYAIAFLISFQMATVFSEFRQVGHVVLHALRIGLTGHNYSGPFRPIDEWGGLIAIGGFLLGVLFVVHIVRGWLRRVRRPGNSFTVQVAAMSRASSSSPASQSSAITANFVHPVRTSRSRGTSSPSNRCQTEMR